MAGFRLRYSLSKALPVIRQPILWLFAVLALGVGAGDLLDSSAALFAPLAILSAMSLVVAWRTGRGVAAGSLVTVALLGAWAAAGRRAPPPLAAACDDGAERWRGTIDAAVERAVNPVTGNLIQRTVLTELAERCGEVWQPRGGRVSIGLFGHANVARGDRIDLELRLDPLDTRRNPIGPDPLAIARQQRLRAHGVASSAHVHTAYGRGPLALLDRLRARAAERFERLFEPEVAALAKALAMGDRASLSPEARERWAAAGVAHLLAISGLHIGLIAWLIYTLALALAGRISMVTERSSARRFAAAGSIPLVILFCLWTGAAASAIRATIMAVAFLGGLALGRRSSAANALGVAGAGILLFDPTSLYDASFLLSFAAVGMLLLVPRLEATRSLPRRLGRAVAATVIASVVATLATAPVTAYHFGRVSLVAPLTNLFAVPWGTLVTVPLALLFTLLAPVSTGLEWLLGYALRFALGGLDGIASLGAAIPFASLDLPKPTGIEIAAYATVLLGSVLSLRAKWLRLVAAAALLCLAGSLLWRLAHSGGDGELHLIHPYVRQGDAALILLPEGGVMLFDAGGTFEPGGWDPGRQVLAPLLRARGIRRVDVAVLSHPDPDHLNGFIYLSAAFPITELWWNGADGEEAAVRKVLANVTNNGGEVRLVAELPATQVREGVTLSLIHPRPGPGDAEGLPYFPELTDNDNSVVLHLRFGDRTAILLGDIEAEAETRLAGGLPPAEIFKSPHHGSRGSSTPALIEALGAKVVIISCGQNNRFGFPKPETVARYQHYGLQILRTDLDGAIEARTDSGRWRIESLRGRDVTLAQ